MARVPGLLQNKKGYWFVRWVDRETGARRERTFGKNKGKAERRYEEWRREFAQLLYSAQPEQTTQPARSVTKQPKQTTQPARLVTKQPKPARAVISRSIDELVISYLNAHRDRYISHSFKDYTQAGKLLSETFGACAIGSFKIPQFEQLIECMIEKDWALRTINARINAVKSFFKYALRYGLVTGEQFHQLNSGVSRVRSDDRRVKPARKVPPVPVDVVERTLPYLTAMVTDIVRVQLRAGMRAAEVCQMRFDELAWDDNGVLWYRPVKHKNASRGKKRDIPLGPESQKILESYDVTRENLLSADTFPREYVFDPRDVERWKPNLKRKKRTRTILYYGTARYGDEIRCGVNRAVAAGAIKESERWKSHQLRHRALTDARREYGLDAAQLLGGHSDAKTTERYAAPDLSKAAQAAMERG